MSSSPLEVLQRWLDAWAAGDEGRARGLLAPDAVVHTTRPRETAGAHVGYDAFVEWFADKQARTRQTGYRVRGMSGTREHAVALFVLAGSPRGMPVEWEQVAVYRVRDQQIVEIWLHEDEP